MKLTCLFAFMAISLLCCKPASYTLQDYKGKKLTVANGGGFTGKVTEFTLFENGQVFRTSTLTGDTEEKTRLSQERTDQIFSNYEVLGLADIELNSPGNMYFFIEMEENGQIHKIQWHNDMSDQLDRNIRLFYRNFMKFMKEDTNSGDPKH